MLLYGSYMRGAGLKWKHLLFGDTLSCFDLDFMCDFFQNDY
jgi:hypothetical protein